MPSRPPRVAALDDALAALVEHDDRICALEEAGARSQETAPLYIERAGLALRAREAGASMRLLALLLDCREDALRDALSRARLRREAGRAAA